MNREKIKRPAPRSQPWGLMAWADIPSKVQPDMVYLRRLRLVSTPWGGVYVHWIFEPDADRHLHDHPWPFASLVLRGGYVERFTTMPFAADIEPWPRLWDRWSVHMMGTRAAHKITEVLPGTVTMIVVGRRCRTWGFWIPNRIVPLTNRFVSWTEYGSEVEGW